MSLNWALALPICACPLQRLRPQDVPRFEFGLVGCFALATDDGRLALVADDFVATKVADVDLIFVIVQREGSCVP